MSDPQTAIRLSQAALRLGGRTVWSELTLEVPQGEFLAVIGPNGAGKTSLLRALLGLTPLAAGKVAVRGRPPRRGDAAIGYVPQQKSFDRDLPLRGRDLVGFGLDGHRWGFALRNRTERERIDAAIRQVGAASFADAPVGRLSGGEQQRLRIAQALLGEPDILLCDEPLNSLDLHHQQEIVGLIADWNRRQKATVVLVTHDVNPVLGATGRVLCIASGRWAAGAPEEVLTSETLSRLYGLPVEVLRIHGRIVVLGAELGSHEPLGAHTHSAP